MLPHKYRLHTKEEIDALYKKARHHRTGPLLISLAPGLQGTVRATVIISKKFSLLATKRNKQKRILRAALADILANERDQFPHDLAIAYTKPGKMISYEEACQMLQTVLNPYFIQR